MKTPSLKSSLFLCLFCLLFLPGCQAALVVGPPSSVSNPPPAVGATPESTVRAFLDAVADRQVDKLRDLLADTKTCHVTQESDIARPGIWVENWDEWLKWLANNEQGTHVVETLTVTNLTDDLASVTLAGHVAGHPIRFHALVVLTRKVGGSWRITSWTQENTLN